MEEGAEPPQHLEGQPGVECGFSILPAEVRLLNVLFPIFCCLMKNGGDFKVATHISEFVCELRDLVALSGTCALCRAVALPLIRKHIHPYDGTPFPISKATSPLNSTNPNLYK